MTKSNDLRLAPSLTVPDDLVTLTIGILGNRGSGKTNTGVVIAEGLLALGHQVVVIDPLDVWWGLKSSADGKAAGYPVIVLGGQHGDVPLADSDGRVIADFVVESRLPVILSLRHVSKAGQRRFMADFAEQVYKRKGEAGRNTPVLFIVDEASSFVPQRVGPDETRMLGAIEDWVRRGRASGIGVTLIDQRAASVNKDVLTQIELLVAHRHTSPQDRKALQEWVRGHDTAGREGDFMGSLASLKQGEAWLWSPNWLDLFRRVMIRARQTYDSSKTPERGQALPAPKAAAEVDLVQLKAQLTKTIEQARENDPKTLKAQIAGLQADLRKAHAAQPVPVAPKIERVHVAVITEDDLAALQRMLDKSADLVTQMRGFAEVLKDSDKELTTLAFSIRAKATKLAAEHRPPSSTSNLPTYLGPLDPKSMVRLAKITPLTAPMRPGDQVITVVTGRQQQILDALGWLESIGQAPASRVQVALLADASPNSSAYTNNLGALRTAGLIDYPGAGTLRLTEAGQGAARRPDARPTTYDLQQTLLRRLGGKKADILKALIEAYPHSMSRERLADESQASATSSAFTNNLGALRSLGLIDYPTAGHVAALPVLFLGD